MFKTYHKLQGSQTRGMDGTRRLRFKTYHKLQGSQTVNDGSPKVSRSKTYHKLQGSQTKFIVIKKNTRLRHIINYKVLKLFPLLDPLLPRLRHIINYKVLKR